MTNITVATSIVERLQNLGYIAYFAGGWVRDYLLNFPSDDIDIATNAPIEVIQAIFSKTLPVGVSFGIVIVVEEGHQFEIATFRKERDYVDGRRPQFVEPCSPEEDAKRRDFTINGLFYDPIKQQLHDFIHGEQDLKAGIIRAIGNPIDRFKEDRLRMLRAIRYSTRFGFQIEHHTQQAIKELAFELFPAVSKERVYQEFQKMDLYDTLGDSLRQLVRHHLLKVIFPELSHLEDSILINHIHAIDLLPKKTPLITKLSYLFHEFDTELKLQSLGALKISKKELNLIAYIDLIKESFTKLSIDDYQLAQLYSHEFFTLAVNFFKHIKGFQKEAIHAEKHAESLKSYIEKIQKKSPLITSNDLIIEGVMPGQLMGRILKEAEKISVNEKILDKSLLMKRLKASEIWPFK
jgi:poly(A) polymerase